MDTLLNLGLNDEVVECLAAQRGERFAFDCYRRLLDMFGDVVLGVPHKEFEREISDVKVSRRLTHASKPGSGLTTPPARPFTYLPAGLPGREV